jgi:phosphohistidine phosphatase SixA
VPLLGATATNLSVHGRMTICFLRHGDAVQSPSLHDSERPLSALGMQQGSRAGKFLRATQTGIGRILASPLLRAQQAAAAVRGELDSPPVVTSEYLSSSSAPRQILDQLRSLDAPNVLLVGHEPHLSKTISLLISGEEGQKVEMRKGSVACVEIPLPLEPGRGTLRWLVTFEQMGLSYEA